MAEPTQTLEAESQPALSDVEAALQNGRWPEAARLLASLEAPEIADFLPQVAPIQQGILFRLLPRDLESEVFLRLEPDAQNSLLQSLTDDETRRVLADIAPDDRTQLFEELPGTVTQRLLNLLSPSDLAEARQLLGYPPESVGRLMTPDYVAVRAHWTAAQVLRHIRRIARRAETIGTVYVVDDAWRLRDAIDVSKVILADPEADVASLMDNRYISIPASADREEAVRVMQRYDLYALPVVDSNGVLVGIVTIDDVLDVAQEEATEDFQKSGAVAPLGVSYEDASVPALYRKRVGWLMALVFVSLVSSGILAHFEETLEAVIALAFFIPLLMGTGGNTGSQSATLMVRAMATGEAPVARWLAMVGRELLVGVALGVSLGAVASGLGLWRGGATIGLIIGGSMALIVLAASFTGIVMPMILARLKLDPAAASSPLITSVMDALGLLIYFSVATAVLRWADPA